MPARTFWAQQHPVVISWTYQVDLTSPRGGSSLSCVIRDPAGVPMAIGSCIVPDDAIEEAMPALLSATWYGYLHQEPHELQSTLSAAVAPWRARKR